MTTAADIVAEARSWIDTPFHWQASVKGVGADCKGLIWGVARELGLPESESVYALRCDYGVKVPVGLLREGMAAVFDRVRDPRPGDVLLLKIGHRAQHLGIHAGSSLIHTYSRGRRRVLATPLSVALRAMPLDSAWRWRSLEAA